ncbi:MAG: LysR family transcriptional regulator, partial [Oscillospiraceae bacterium]
MGNTLMEVTITNIIQLKYFVCVAASGSFSEAAELMFSTQSTVSKQIFSLEKDLNAQLFDRSKRKIVLTSQGKAVLRNAQIMLDDYNNMLSELAQLNAYDDSTVRIKSTPVLIPYNILTLLANFRKLNPWVKM